MSLSCSLNLVTQSTTSTYYICYPNPLSQSAPRRYLNLLRVSIRHVLSTMNINPLSQAAHLICYPYISATAIFIGNNLRLPSICYVSLLLTRSALSAISPSAHAARVLHLQYVSLILLMSAPNLPSPSAPSTCSHNPFIAPKPIQVSCHQKTGFQLKRG